MDEIKKILLILSVMDEIKKEEFVSEAKGLCKLFQLDVTLKLFGKIVREWHFPPK